MGHKFVIGLGTNLGARASNLTNAVEQVARLQVRLEAVSRVYESAAVGPPQPDYLNAALRLETDLSAELLLSQLLAVEKAFGRTRDVRWGPRVLDLDILWGTEIWRSAVLTVPHMQLPVRTFALAPLLDVAPELAPRYGDLLQRLGGPPPLHGTLRFDAERGACAFSTTDVL